MSRPGDGAFVKKVSAATVSRFLLPLGAPALRVYLLVAEDRAGAERVFRLTFELQAAIARFARLPVREFRLVGFRRVVHVAERFGLRILLVELRARGGLGLREQRRRLRG